MWPARWRTRTVPLETPPCRKLPREQWCDKNGPGGFMGHTCAHLDSILSPITRPDFTRITRFTRDDFVRKLQKDQNDKD